MFLNLISNTGILLQPNVLSDMLLFLNFVIEHIRVFQVFRETKLKNFDFDQYETEQIFYPSKDGTKIPMFIVKKKVIIM